MLADAVVTVTMEHYMSHLAFGAVYCLCRCLDENLNKVVDAAKRA